MHPRSHRTRLSLEVLEDRAVPAAVTTTNLLQTDVEAQSGLTRRFADASAPTPVPDGLNVVDLAELVAISATPLPPSVQLVSAPGLLSPSSSSVPQAQPGTSATPVANSPLSPDVDALGFTGRIVLPGTGVQALVANGAGPLTQPAGLYLVGGSQDSSEVSGTPAPAAKGEDEGEAGVATAGLVPDEVWAGTDWSAQTTALRG